MIEPSDLFAAVNRLLACIGQIVTAAVLLGVITLLSAKTGNTRACNAAVLSLAFTTACYALQVFRMTPVLRGLALAALGASWVAGFAAVALFLFAGG